MTLTLHIYVRKKSSSTGQFLTEKWWNIFNYKVFLRTFVRMFSIFILPCSSPDLTRHSSGHLGLVTTTVGAPTSPPSAWRAPHTRHSLRHYNAVVFTTYSRGNSSLHPSFVLQSGVFTDLTFTLIYFISSNSTNKKFQILKVVFWRDPGSIYLCFSTQC